MEFAASDDSFAWSDASNDSNMVLDLDNEYGNKSERSYKKKIQEQLFKDESVKASKKAEKRKHNELSEHNNTENFSNKRIKSEPESDVDFPKKKTKKLSKTVHNHESTESNDYDDSYLNNRVKLELKLEKSTAEKTSVKLKKRKNIEPVTNDKDINSINHDDSYLNCSIKLEPNSFAEPAPVTSKKKKHKDAQPNDKNYDSTDLDESYLNYRVKLEQESSVDLAAVKLKKKKKHKRECESLSNDQGFELSTNPTVENSHLGHNLIVFENVDESQTKKKKNKCTYVATSDKTNSDDDFQEAKKIKNKKRDKLSKSYHDESEISQCEEISCIESSIINNHHLDDDQAVNDEVNNKSKNYESNLINDLSSSKQKETKETIKISERLRFEDDTIDYDPEKHLNETAAPKKLKNFLTVSKHLSVIFPKVVAEPFITDDDEIWIIKGPHELNVKDFKDVNIKLDTKGKLKLNGQSYDSIIDKSVEKVPILSYIYNKAYIQNVPLVGSINLRKRIPKTYIPEENVMINHQPSFIPLPEIKCRHPLFGINYKKAIKVPSSVVERLNNTNIEVTLPENNVKGKKKKHKKHKRKLEIDSESERKPKKMKFKHNPDSAEAWESEKAIEKNLFDF